GRRELGAGRFLGFLRRDMDRHVARQIIDNETLGIGPARRIRLAVDSRAHITPRADEAARNVAFGIDWLAHQDTDTYCVSRNSIRPSCAPSRPMPDCFMPPKGAAGSETRPRLSPIMPKSSFSETRMPRLRSFV